MDCSPQCSSVHGILQTRILEWVTIPSSRDTSKEMQANIYGALTMSWASLVAHMIKNPLATGETWVRFPGWEDPLEGSITTHSSILALAGYIPWGRRVGHD